MQKIRITFPSASSSYVRHPALGKDRTIKSGEEIDVSDELGPESFEGCGFEVEFIDSRMSGHERCAVCSMWAKRLKSLNSDEIHLECRQCGEFKIAESVNSFLQNLSEAKKANVSGWIADQNSVDTIPILSRDVAANVSVRSLPPIDHRANRILLDVIRRENRLGEYFSTDSPRFIAVSYSQDTHEVRYLMQLLVEMERVRAVSDGGIYQVLPSGYVAASELASEIGDSDKGFVAMSFSPDLDVIYQNGLQIGILNAGYEPVRVDQLEHTNRIDDEIIARIKGARFVVADFTDHRSGVYFEAGFALGLGLPVIWTCRDDDMSRLHFDIRQYNTINWKTADELASRLRFRIEAVVGRGPAFVAD